VIDNDIVVNEDHCPWPQLERDLDAEVDTTSISAVRRRIDYYYACLILRRGSVADREERKLTDLRRLVVDNDDVARYAAACNDRVNAPVGEVDPFPVDNNSNHIMRHSGFWFHIPLQTLCSTCSINSLHAGLLRENLSCSRSRSAVNVGYVG
jgi:hypothetical protein